MAGTIKPAKPKRNPVDKPTGTTPARPKAVLVADKPSSPEIDSSTWSEEEVNKWAVSMTGKPNEPDKRVAKVRTLRHDAVRPVLRRNKFGKVDSYSTTASIIVKDWNKRGEMFYAVIPTVFRDDPGKEPTVHDEEEALARYRKTGDSWGGMYSYDDACRLSQAVHEKHSRKFNRDWNAYLATAPLEDLAQESRDDPRLTFMRKAVDAVYDYVRPEEGWDAKAVRVGSAYRVGPGLLGDRYVRGGNGFRTLVRNTVNDKMDVDHEAGVYAAKNRIYDVLAARGNNGSSVPLFDPEVTPETVGRDLVVLGSLGYHYGQSAPLTIDLGNNTTNAIATALASAKYTQDGGRDVTGRRMRDFEYLTGKPGKELADFTKDQEMKERIDLLSLPGKGSYTDSPAYPRRDVRQATKGGESEPGGEMTESADSVNGEPVADVPVMSGPRIVINPSTFRNKKDALCVAFNERFRIAMEQYGFDPQSEPTPKQRRFFADTAYADDEVQLRRTILARILTLDTSVKDPTDEQLAEAMQFLQEFKENEEPETDFEAQSIDKLANLVAAVYEKRPG